ncbi:MAG: hypothetical protein V7752_04260 [Halopseudomonas sp.]
MNETNLLDVVPSVMSAIATAGAAIAAFGSVRVSREAKKIAQQSALAVHHGSAANALSEAVETLDKMLEPFSDLAYEVWEGWSREIESLDHRDAGGSNPRPMRHVLTNASEMLVEHGSARGTNYRHAERSMFSIVRQGIDTLSDSEYDRLLRRGDGEYCDFESVFGPPPLKKSITTSPAFRWAIYQLNRRINIDDWLNIWTGSWVKNGWLNRYCEEHKKIKPTLKSVLTLLKSERAKLAHSVFPLEANPSLSLKYDKVLEVLEVLIEDCGLEIWEGHRKKPHKEDVVALVVYSMGIAFLSSNARDNLFTIN